MSRVEIDMGAAALVSVTLNARVIQTLAEKGVITADEAVKIYKDSLAILADPEREKAKSALKALMGNLPI